MTITDMIEDNIDDLKYESFRMKFGDIIPASYSCSWFDGNSDKDGVFPEESLNEGTVE